MRTHEAYFLVCITMINQEERWIWWETCGGARRLEEDHNSHLVYLPQVPPERRPCSSSSISIYVDESSSGSTTAAVVKRAQQRATRESKIGPSREARMVVFIGGSSTWIHLGTHPRSGGHGIVGVGCVFFPFVYFFNPSWLNHGNVGVLACFFFISFL